MINTVSRGSLPDGSDPALLLGMVIALNIGVLGLFSLESMTMAKLFGSRTRFTQPALAKEISGIPATAIGPPPAATLTAVTGSVAALAGGIDVAPLITHAFDDAAGNRQPARLRLS